MFSVMFESHYTFLVISTAILGLGMGGIFVHIRARRISEPYGVPPPVVFQYVPQELKEGISELLFSMHRNLEGKKILQKLMIVRFSDSSHQRKSGMILLTG
jgi:hypothetical protein